MRRWRNLDPEAVRAANRKQAHGPRGRARDRARRAPRPGWSCRRATAPGRPSWCCRARRASCSRCGARRSRPRSSGRPSGGAPTTSSGCCGCSASRSPRSPRRCGWPRRRWTASTRWRSRPACGAARSRSWCATSRRRSRPGRAAALIAERHGEHAVLDRRLDGRRAGRRAAPGALVAAGGVVHGRADGRAADRAGRVVGLLRGGVVAYSNEAKVGAAGRRPGADRALRGGVAGGGRRDGGRRAGALRGRHRGRDHRRRRARAAGPRRSRSATSAGAASWPTARRSRATSRLPGDRAEVRDRSTTVGMHLLRRRCVERSRRLSGRGALFVALDLPERRARRSAAGATRCRRHERPAARSAEVAARDARLPRPAGRGGRRARSRLPALGGWPGARAGAAGPGRGARRAAAAAAAVRARPRGPGRRVGRGAGGGGGRARRRRLYEPEKRPFWPHVTLARVARRAREPPRIAAPPPAAVRGAEVCSTARGCARRGPTTSRCAGSTLETEPNHRTALTPAQAAAARRAAACCRARCSA